MATKRVLRRQPKGGTPWGLWRVDVPNAGPLGYLVTTMGRFPRPLAFTLGTSKESLAAALRVYATMDQRKPRRHSWRKWLGFLLVPVDSRGRRIARQFFVGAKYMEDGWFAMGTKCSTEFEEHFAVS